MTAKTDIQSNHHIIVALSGGVDSSTAALLLKQCGYRVEGVIMVFEGVSPEKITAAARVAEHLKIDFRRVDMHQEFRELIISDFIAEYGRGRTPNPCVLCNELMKFNLLFTKVSGAGIDKIATGHYAKIDTKRGRHILKKGCDKNEQSYFLYRLNQNQLSRTILPLGQYTKDEVREIARKNNLPTAKQRKSQDICFIPNGDNSSFLKKSIPANPGPILNSEGEEVGQHKGIIHYTIGQRHGIRISHKHPYYVMKIDAAKNAIYIGEKQDIYKREFTVTHLNFIPFDTLERGMQVSAKVRYFSPDSEARIEPIGQDKVKVVFTKPQWAIAPGQSAVFYQKDMVIGGGIIDEVFDYPKA